VSRVPTILTIGYAHATQAALVAALTGAGVELLADVRALANSRRPGFSKNSLRAAVEEAGIGYRQFKRLGTPKEGRDAARRGDYATLKRVYSGQLELPEALGQMAELCELALHRRTCLLCYCQACDACHRGLLVKELFADFERLDLEPAAG